jgi:hypothetical protein
VQDKSEGGVMIENRRRMMVQQVGGVPPLPSEYQEVEYLEGTGTQYITLSFNGLASDFNMHIETYASVNQVSRPLGNENWNIKYDGTLILFKSPFHQYTSNYIYYTNIDPYNVVISWEFECFDDSSIYRVYRDGALHIEKVSTPVENNPKQFTYYMFGIPNDRFKGRIFNHWLTNRMGAYTYKYIPCYRKSDNKPGMYDVVNNVFHTNEGQDEFIVGPDVN